MRRERNGLARSLAAAALGLAPIAPAAVAAQDGGAGSESIDVVERGLESRIDALVEPYVDMGMFSGVVLVAKGDEIVFLKPYGYADYALSVPLRADHRFRIASLSKQFMNAAIAVLVDDGVISPDTPLAEFLPEFPRADEITVRHLVEHTSGVPHTNRLEALEGRTRIELDEMVSLLAARPLDFDPGTDESYSNGGYDLLAALIERASGASYEHFLGERVLEPLGLDGTGRLRTYRIVPDLVRGTLPGRRPGTRGEPRFYPSELRIGGGSLYSTAEDVFTLFRATFQRELASAETSDFLFWDSTRRYEITGRAPGFAAKVFIDIPRDITVVSLANNYSWLVQWGQRLYREAIGEGWETAAFEAVARAIPLDRAPYYEGRYEGYGDVVSLSVDEDGGLIYDDVNNDWSVAMIPLDDERWLHPFFDIICRFEGEAHAERMACLPALTTSDEPSTFTRVGSQG